MISVYQAKDHRWRDSYNPLRGLNMARLVGMLEKFYSSQPPLAYFEFSPVASDRKRPVVKDAVDLSKAGLKMDAGEVAEKTGYALGQS